MKVKELIRLLNIADLEQDLSIEGCDCEADPVGLSVSEDKKTIIIRRKDGCYDGLKFLITPDKLAKEKKK